MNNKFVTLGLLLIAASGSLYANDVAYSADNGCSSTSVCCPAPKPACCVRSCWNKCSSPRSYKRNCGRSCAPVSCARSWRNCSRPTCSPKVKQCRAKVRCCPKARCCRPKPACCPAPAPVCEAPACVVGKGSCATAHETARPVVASAPMVAAEEEITIEDDMA